MLHNVSPVRAAVKRALGMTPRRAIDERDVLAGARRALAEHGWDGATLERIADAAGVSRVTLHRRGLSRERILEQLAGAAVAEYREALWPALTGAGPAAERLERALAALCEVAERNAELLLALGAVRDAIFHEDGEETLTRSAFTEPLERLLRDGAADGSLRVLDPAEGATVLFNLVGWTFLHLRTGHRWSAERARRATLDVALHGVRAAASDGYARAGRGRG